MIFYYAPHTCALASHIALETVGAAYEAKRVDFKSSQQQSPGYKAINPKARVPSLVTDQGVLTETPAILVYISQRFPQFNLAPLDNPFYFAKVQEFNSYLCSTVHVAHAHRMRGYRWADGETAWEAMKNKVPQSVGECFDLIENTMFRGPFVMGDDYTICDMYLFTFSQWLEADGLDPNRFPKVAAFRQRMLGNPVVKKTISAQLGN